MYKELIEAFLAYLRKRYKEASQQHMDAFHAGVSDLVSFWAHRTHEYGNMLFMLEMMVATAVRNGEVKRRAEVEDSTLALLEADNARLRMELGKLVVIERGEPSCCDAKVRVA